MRRLLLSWVTGTLLSLACCAPSDAQDKTPDPAAKVTETKSGGSTPVAVYTLAAIGTIIVMVLVCMPARRE